MANISMSFHQDLTCARNGQYDAVKPVVTGLIKGGAPSQLPTLSKPFSTLATDLEFEVFCPNCARVEFASTCDLFKHKCNCGYGVSVEMLRTSPN